MKLYHARPADRLVFCVGRRWTLAEDPSGETAGYAYIDIGRTRFILHIPKPRPRHSVNYFTKSPGRPLVKNLTKKFSIELLTSCIICAIL